MIFSELIMISNQILLFGKDVFDIYVFSRVTIYIHIHIYIHMITYAQYKYIYIYINILPVVPHKAVAEVSKIGNL